MKATIKMVISHFFVITVAVLLVTSISEIIDHGFSFDYTFSTSYPWTIILTGVLGALPSFLFYFKKEPTRKQFLIRTIIHFVLIVALILTEGKLVGWYSDLGEGLSSFVAILAIYVLVWLATYLTGKNTAKGINKALQNFNSKNDDEL